MERTDVGTAGTCGQVGHRIGERTARVTVPVSWTDRGPKPSVNRLTVEGLAELDTLGKMLEDR